MENASKALVIAGGVLIAIMIIATLLYASSTWNIIPQRKDDNDAAKQLAAFNQQYETYVRDYLYGTDIISVLNKAIDNNEKYNVNFGDKMYVNIVFELNSPVQSSTITYREYFSGAKKGTKESTTPTNVDTAFLNGTRFSLQVNSVKIKEFITAFSGENSNRTRTTTTYGKDDGGNYREYTETIPNTSEFKSRIFKCEDSFGYSAVGYDEDGRINYIFFREQNLDDSDN